MSIVKDFSEEQLIFIINEELRAAGNRARVCKIEKIEGHSFLIAKTTRNAKLVIQPVCIYPRYSMGIRAIHRIVDKHKSFSYLPNGQGGRNLHNLLFNGENGDVYNVWKQKIFSYHA